MQRFAFVIFAGAISMLLCDTASACRFRNRSRCSRPCSPVLTVVIVPSLTAATARDALIEMLTGKEPPNFDTRSREIDALKQSKNIRILEKDAEGILSGFWNCDLFRSQFHFIAPIGSCLYECHGDFEYRNGRWTAKVTGSSWAHFGPMGPPK